MIVSPLRHAPDEHPDECRQVQHLRKPRRRHHALSPGQRALLIRFRGQRNRHRPAESRQDLQQVLPGRLDGRHDGEGSGLGLYLVQQIAETPSREDGRRQRRGWGKGSVFTLTLPPARGWPDEASGQRVIMKQTREETDPHRRG
ncbi:MAG: hypothetical protein MZV70_75630 [Desulfobacterales bacterium]|nr:hypothetical protein [Desulfobacterales bacterium]